MNFVRLINADDDGYADEVTVNLDVVALYHRESKTVTRIEFVGGSSIRVFEAPGRLDKQARAQWAYDRERDGE